MRVMSMSAPLTMDLPVATMEHLDQVMATFEVCCTVSHPVGAAMPITVEVFDSTGAKLK